MKPVDFRNETFDQLKERLNEDRKLVHDAWLAHGPGTTRAVADKAGIDILTFRPRSTELFQMALLEVTGKEIHSGIYRARTIEEWEKVCAEFRTATTGQLALKME